MVPKNRKKHHKSNVWMFFSWASLSTHRTTRPFVTSRYDFHFPRTPKSTSRASIPKSFSDKSNFFTAAEWPTILRATDNTWHSHAFNESESQQCDIAENINKCITSAPKRMLPECLILTGVQTPCHMSIISFIIWDKQQAWPPRDPKNHMYHGKANGQNWMHQWVHPNQDQIYLKPNPNQPKWYTKCQKKIPFVCFIMLGVFFPTSNVMGSSTSLGKSNRRDVALTISSEIADFLRLSCSQRNFPAANWAKTFIALVICNGNLRRGSKSCDICLQKSSLKGMIV